MAESSNSSNVEETELTMCDVLQEEQELEEDANAVLGASDDTNCSYDKGYVSRQALYACTTCTVNDDPGGICLACCYACHDGHEVVELYTKRNFRCDCGNGKFPKTKCTLRPGKDPLNIKNKYNQNFKGLYCNCSRPYPDLEDNTSDEMIQCIMCEDWYHGRHIGIEIPEDFSEMICGKCMESHKFLYHYLNKFHCIKVDTDCHKEKRTSPKKLSSESEVGIQDSVPKTKEENAMCVKSEVQESNDGLAIDFNQQTNPNGHENDKEIKQEIGEDIKQEIMDVKIEELKHCILKKMEIDKNGITSGPGFWPENWRKELCHCSICMDMYSRADCQFLLNLDDTIQAYEEQGKHGSNESQYDKGLSALSQMDRVKQMEAIRAYTNMKGQLKEYLKEFADNKRTVCESDIKEFFERIGKRQKLSNGVPHFCR